MVPPNPVIPAGPLPGNTGQIFNSQWNFNGAFKADLNDRISYLLAVDQPLAGDTSYGAGTFQFPVYQGTSAEVDTFQVTAALSYDVTPSVKIYGGPRAQRYDAKSTVSFSNYDVDAEAKWGYGYLLGAAYEKPEIALRVALTYYSAINYVSRPPSRP